MLGIPLWLQSYVGELIALLVLPIGALRILVEENPLRHSLAGYLEYQKREPYCLIP